MVAQTLIRKFAVTAVAGLMAAGAAAGTAQAAPDRPVQQERQVQQVRYVKQPLYRGRVIARTGLKVRTGPGVNYPSRPPVVPYGTVVRIECKVQGGNVGGNRLWYKLKDSRFYPGYVAARFVENVGPAPHFCPRARH